MIPWLWSILQGPGEEAGLLGRSMGAAATAFAIGLMLAPGLIRLLRRQGITDRPKPFGGLNVLTKSGVPTMGGALILASTIASAALWCQVTSRFVLVAVAAGVYFAVVGAIDDVRKARSTRSEGGLSRGAKYAAQIAFGAALAVVMMLPETAPIPLGSIARTLYLPFIRSGIYLGLGIVPLVIFFIVFASNSVNLTDGMDGLAIMPVIFVAIVLGLFAYLGGRVDYSEYLRLYSYQFGTTTEYYTLRGSGELMVLCAATVGGGAAFLWHNAHPASLFMGDTGSLALGGMLGTIAVLIRQEAIFVIAGGLFVAELASSFIQDYIGLKLLGRRIFPRAPLHLSLLHRGTGETKVTTRLWIFAAMCALLALATLKLR